MNIEQMVYTSCKRGIGAGPGFQTQATSPGLTWEHRFELEQLQAYRYPRGLPTNPTPQDIRRYCPPNYQLTQFTDGHTAVTRSAYAGADYSGRRGNFIAHSLVLPPVSDIWPIDLSLWGEWRETVTDEPPQLNAIDPSAVRIASPSLDFASLASFIREKADRFERLAVMLDALLSSRVANRPVIIRDSVANLTGWLGCLTKLLPRNMSPCFTFASFVNSQLAGVDIQCTTPDSDLKISSEELDYRAFAFDLVDERFSNVASAKDSCGHILAGKLRDTPDWFHSFHHFSERFSFEPDSDRLQCLLTCFALADGGSSIPPQSCERIPDAIGFAGSALRQDEDGNSMISRLVERAVQIAKTAPAERLRVSEGLRKLATTASSPQFRSVAVHSSVRLIHDELLDGGANWRPLLSKLDDIAREMDFRHSELQSLLLRSDVLKQIAVAHQNAPEHMQHLLHFLAMRAERTNASSAGISQAFRDALASLIAATSHAKIVGPLLAVTAESGGQRAFCELCIELADGTSDASICDAVGMGVANALDHAFASNASEVRQSLIKQDQLGILLLELNYRSKNVNANFGGFLDCLSSLRKSLPRRRKAELVPVVVAAWRNASRDTRDGIATWLFSHSDIVAEIDSKVAGEMIGVMAAQIPLDRFDRQASALANTVQKLCKVARCDAPVQIPLRVFLENLCRGRTRSLTEVHSAWSALGPQVDPSTGSAVVAQSLFPLLAMTRVPKEHIGVLEWACSVGGQEGVGVEYRRVLKSKEFANISPDAAGAFVVATLAVGAPSSALERLLECANQELDSWLHSLSGKSYAELNRYVRSYQKELSKDKINEWSARRTRADCKRRSLLGRILRFVGLRVYLLLF